MIDLDAIAKKYEFEFARDTGIEINGYKIYSLGFSQLMEVGLPAFLLVKGDEVKMLDGLEGKKLHHWLCVNYYNDEEDKDKNIEE